MVAWIALSFVVAICAALLAERKGRSVAGWLIATLLFWPAILVLICLPALTEGVERLAIEAGTHRSCPSCAELVRAQAKICRYCGRDLPSLPLLAGARHGMRVAHAIYGSGTLRVLRPHTAIVDFDNPRTTHEVALGALSEGPAAAEARREPRLA